MHENSRIVDKLITTPMAGLILGLQPANERQRYLVTMSLIDWTQIDLFVHGTDVK